MNKREEKSQKPVRRIFCISAYQGQDIYSIWAVNENPSRRGNETNGFVIDGGEEFDHVMAIPSRIKSEERIAKLTREYEEAGFQVKTSLGWCPPAEGEFIRRYFGPRG